MMAWYRILIPTQPDTYSSYPTQGWYVPKNSYTGTVDFTVSNTALLSVKGGYFWDNYKDLGAPPRRGSVHVQLYARRHGF